MEIERRKNYRIGDRRDIDKTVKEISVIVTLDNGTALEGTVNIIDFIRFSDFIDNHNNNYIKLYNSRDISFTGTLTKKFLLIPKNKIMHYEPK